MMDGALLVSGASLVLIALALLILAIIATRSRRRARQRVVANARPEVYVTYESRDMWAPPRPEDRAGRS